MCGGQRGLDRSCSRRVHVAESLEPHANLLLRRPTFHGCSAQTQLTDFGSERPNLPGQLRSERFLRAAPSVTGQPSRALCYYVFFFFLKKLYPKKLNLEHSLLARYLIHSKMGEKKKNQSRVQIQARLNVIKAEVRRVATLLSVSVFFFFFLFFLFTEFLQSFLVCVGGTRTPPLPVRTELQERPGIWLL